MDFEYKCVGKGASASTYSYLKEPRIEETGYTRGLKSGSFNYLENGDMDIEEKINYFYGNGTNITNSSLEHKLTVKFNGERGISEIFGRGFFGNNRWISAWKKIRYEESPSMKVGDVGWVSRPSSNIDVDATIRMDTERRMDYEFDYQANIKNGVIEVKDSTGWTNRTGPRKYDWEYESLISGNVLNVTNNLIDSEGIEPAAGPVGDWLPCCYSGTVPPIEQLDNRWPSDAMVVTLQADRILPSTKLELGKLTSAQLTPVQLSSIQLASTNTQLAEKEIKVGMITSVPEMRSGSKQVISAQLAPAQLSPTNFKSVNNYPTKREIKVGIIASVPETQLGPLVDNLPGVDQNGSGQTILTKLTCGDGSCPGYDCINTFDEETVASGISTGGRRVVQEVAIKNVEVTLEVVEVNADAKARFGGSNSSSAKLSEAKQAVYKITVHNSGSVPLNNVIVSSEMAKGMKFDSTRYYEENRGTLEVTRDPLEFNENVRTILAWNIGILAPEEIKSIILVAYLKPQVDEKQINVKVTGNAPDSTTVRDSVNSAEIRECEFRDSNSGQPCAIPSETCKKVCPDWSEIQ
jgi:hypothetical protein